MTQIGREFYRNKDVKKKLSKIKEINLIAIIMGLERYRFIRRVVEGKSGRSPVLTHELSTTLMMNIGFLYESLSNYNYLKKDIRNSKSYNENEKFFECVQTLNSKKTTEFFENALKYARNEGAFHNDVGAIADYYESFMNMDKSNIWSTNEYGEYYSPLATAISGHTIKSVFGDDIVEDGRFITELANSLHYVAKELVNEWL